MKESYIVLKDGRKLGFEDSGPSNGFPIFLLHGTPGSRICELNNESIITRKNLRIITPERPGYGLSDPLPQRTIKDFSYDIEQLADKLNIEMFHVAGVSGGGPYTLACAYYLPNRVLSATLISSAVPCNMSNFSKGMSAGNKLSFFVALHIPFLLRPLYYYSARVLLKNPDKLIEGIKPQLCPWDQEVLNELEANGKLDMFISHIREAYAQGSKGVYSDTILLTKPWDIKFEDIQVPIYMWHGKSDTLMPIEPAIEFSKLLPNCESSFIDNAGHLLLDDEKMSHIITNKIIDIFA